MEWKRLEPMGVGSLLDRSFSVYRQHFKVFFLLVLILFAPLLLLQEVLLSDVSNMPLFVPENESNSLEEFFQNRFLGEEAALTDSTGKILIYLLLFTPISLLMVYPQMQGAAVLITQGAVYGEPVTLKGAIKQSYSRFWPIVGSTAVYGLIAIGVVLLIGLVVFLLAMLGVGVGSVFLEELDTVNPVLAIVLFILAGILFTALFFLVPGFFLLRWAFYLPVVLIERDGIGIGRSWRLTKGNFWRLLALYFVLTVIYTMLSAGIQALLVAVFGFSIFGQLLLILFTCLLTPWMMIVYALAYLDLKVRHDGTDVEALLQEQGASEPAPVGGEADERP